MSLQLDTVEMAEPPVFLHPRQEGYILDADGYFQCKTGKSFVPIGVNYWPRSCGLAMWQQWPAAEIREDIRLTKQLGLNTFRFFLLWHDFEPEPGEWNEEAFSRLDEIMEWGLEEGVAMHPALFTGWMSGGLFWPDWKQDKNLFSDPTMRRRSVEFARRCGKALAPWADGILALDLGNELSALPESATAGTKHVASWCKDVTNALRLACPGVLIFAGNDHSQVVAENGWDLGYQPGTDLYSMHAYPAPTWHPVPSDGMRDPLCQSFLPFYTKVARAYGPVIVQEFGTLLTGGREAPREYLTAVLKGCWEAGANGFLWWCLRDINTTAFPYHHQGMERRLGLVDDQGDVKPGLVGLIEDLKDLSEKERPVQAGPIAVLWPESCGFGENGERHHPTSTAAAAALAHYFLGEVEPENIRVTRAEGLSRSPEIKVLFVAVEHLGPDDLATVREWAHAGGRVLWHNLNLLRATPELLHDLGLRLEDFRGAHPAQVMLGGREWLLESFPGDMRFDIANDDDDVEILRDSLGIAVASHHRTGRGSMVAVFACVEKQILGCSVDRSRRDAWTNWYRGILEWGENRG